MFDWQPTTNLEALKLRAGLLQKIRAFFAERQVLEVETPLLSHGTITDPNILSFITSYGLNKPVNLYLQTSPEFAMKRLLSSGSGSIYQICKAFRHEDFGSQHNPEFTILEWYRLDFDHHALMQDMDEFLQYTANTKPAEKLSYQEAFKKYLNIDPLAASLTELISCARQNGLNDIDDLDRDGWLNILMSTFIEPNLGLKNKPTIIYDYPSSQAALARISTSNPAVAERFEVYIDGIELANGFHELANAKEQRQRFVNDLFKRKQLNIPEVAIDENFLAALAHDFPDCAGVALGIDRLLMIIAKTKNIADVIAFPISRA